MINLLCKDRETHKVSIEVSLEEEKERDITVCVEASSLEVLLSQKTKWWGIGTPGPSQSAGSLNQVRMCIVHVIFKTSMKETIVLHISPTKNIVYILIHEKISFMNMNANFLL